MPPKKKTKAKVKAKAKLRKKKAFTVTVSGTEIRYFVCVPSKSELKALKGKGISTGGGVMTLSETLSGVEESTWVGPWYVSAFVNDKQIPIKFKNNVKPQWESSFKGENVIFVEHTTDRTEFTAEVSAYSADEIRVEMYLTARWTLPDGREIEIYSLTVFSPLKVDLEWQGGGGGYISGELITADGKSVGLDEEENEDTGEYRITVSDD